MRAAALRTLARARAAAGRSQPWADPAGIAAAWHPGAWGPARPAAQSRTARGTAAFAAAAGMAAKTPKIYIMYYSLCVPRKLGDGSGCASQSRRPQG